MNSELREAMHTILETKTIVSVDPIEPRGYQSLEIHPPNDELMAEIAVLLKQFKPAVSKGKRPHMEFDNLGVTQEGADELNAVLVPWAKAKGILFHPAYAGFY
jgi:hypothetical protein